MSVLRLSDRMRAVGSMVIPGKPVADIGTDHGYIPADLLMRGIVPFAILTDINEGPLSICAENLKESGISPELYELRCGDGLTVLEPGEVSTVIIAGMGGELMMRMFDKADETLFEDCRFVLQPRTHADDLRAYLTSGGFSLCDYKLAKERGRICEIFAAERCAAGEANSDGGLISELLLSKNDPLTAEFLDAKIRKAHRIAENASSSGRTDAREATEVWKAVAAQLEEIRRNI